MEVKNYFHGRVFAFTKVTCTAIEVGDSFRESNYCTKRAIMWWTVATATHKELGGWGRVTAAAYSTVKKKKEAEVEPKFGVPTSNLRYCLL